MAASAPHDPSLRASDFDRARLLDMTQRILPATLFASALCGVAVITLLSKVGDLLLVPLALGASGQLAIGFVFPRMARPERWILAGDCLSVVSISWGVALTGGFQSPAIPLLVLPLVAVAGRHTLPIFIGFTVFALAAPVVAALVAINQGIDYGDTRVVADFATIGGVAVIIIALMHAERHYRHQSLLDPLTGLLNRFALDRRLDELRTQAAQSGAAVCVIAADLDEFKAINDAHGHDVGDVVLCEVADTLRSSLRTFSLLYRTGGEEFVAILPGLDSRGGAIVAERLRSAVEASQPRGLRATMSVGVAAAAGERVDSHTLLTAADRCLYEAKRAGRNRVVAEGVPGAVRAVAAHSAERSARSAVEEPVAAG
jgi:diguanylate cyclase (GGDEF)-like protein